MEEREVTEYVTTNTNNIRRRNPIAAKFAGVAATIKTLGYGAAIILPLLIMVSSEMEGEGIVAGLIIGLVLAVITWLSCLTWEAVSEALQLLEDIKNK